MSTQFGPKDIMYKPVVDSNGEPVGKVVNITQNGSGNFEIFGVDVEKAASVKMNHGNTAASGPVFLDMELIETVDMVVRLKKRVGELLDDVHQPR